MKVKTSILLGRPTRSEVDVGGSVEAEPYHQHSITCCCHMRDGNRPRSGLTKWHLTWNCVWGKSVSLNSCIWKKKLHPLTFTRTATCAFCPLCFLKQPSPFGGSFVLNLHTLDKSATRQGQELINEKQNIYKWPWNIYMDEIGEKKEKII